MLQRARVKRRGVTSRRVGAPCSTLGGRCRFGGRNQCACPGAIHHRGRTDRAGPGGGCPAVPARRPRRHDARGSCVGLHAVVRQAETQCEQAARCDREAKAAHDEAQNALTEARDRLGHCRAALERQRELEREVAAMLREQEVQRAQLEARLARLAEQRDELECDRGGPESESQATETELGAARARLGAAEEAVAAARQAHAAATMEHARARDALTAAVARGNTLASELELWTERARSGAARAGRADHAAHRPGPRNDIVSGCPDGARASARRTRGATRRYRP